MKHLLWLLLLLLMLIPSNAEAAVLWQSYSDSARTVQSDNFTAPGSWVYMKGSGLQKNKTYRSTFYDAQNDIVCIWDGQSDNNGVVLSQVRPGTYPASSPGTWKAELWKVQPLTLEATDIFTVSQSAIPEFENAVASLTIIGLCLFIYRKMKRRRK